MKSYWLKKLVRDNSVTRMAAEGVHIVSRILNDSEYLIALEEKLKEETDELFSAKTADEKAEEIADILELIGSYITVLGISMSTLQKIQMDKKETRGGFNSREFIEYIETPDGSYYDRYCSAAPQKYPVKVD